VKVPFELGNEVLAEVRWKQKAGETISVWSVWIKNMANQLSGR